MRMYRRVYKQPTPCPRETSHVRNNSRFLCRKISSADSRFPFSSIARAMNQAAVTVTTAALCSKKAKFVAKANLERYCSFVLRIQLHSQQRQLYRSVSSSFSTHHTSISADERIPGCRRNHRRQAVRTLALGRVADLVCDANLLWLPGRSQQNQPAIRRQAWGLSRGKVQVPSGERRENHARAHAHTRACA